MKTRILIVEDDVQVRSTTRRLLELSSFEVSEAENGRVALDLVTARLSLGEEPYACILCDLRMPEMDGLTFFKSCQLLGLKTPILLMTAFGTVEDAVFAMKSGAIDFLSKPVKRAELLRAIERALKVSQRIPHASRAVPDQNFVGSSPAMNQVRSRIAKVSPTLATVLIQGESGTGKERVAREIHRQSPRAKSNFVALNCASIPDSLIESELFGHEKGAFSGAVSARAGLFEAASGGTLFLDEIGDMPISLQSSLLRVLQEGEIRRVGAIVSRKVDVRLIAASHRNLRDQVKAGLFREDLLYRLEVFQIELPPLRDRMEDFGSLVQQILVDLQAKLGGSYELAPEAYACLKAHSWPGNVRELVNALESAAVLCDGRRIALTDLPTHLSRAPFVRAASEMVTSDQTAFTVQVGTRLEDVKDVLFKKTLEATNGDKELAAKLLGVASRSLYRWSQGKEG